MKIIKKISIVLTILVCFSSILAYAYYNNSEKETISFNDTIEITAEDMKTTRTGDTNIGSGGDGGGNYGDNTGKGTSITGTVRDEGVRVTMVNAETGAIVTRPLDFANNPMPVTRWFGAVCKLSYLGIGNNKISLTLQSLSSGEYNYKKPDNKLPTIVNGNLQTIKNYFGDRGFLEYFASLTEVPYENLISGKYKLILEPIGYPKIAGKYVACTGTELAMFDKLLNGAIRKSLADFSHKNLPLSMFLEQDDFGIKAYTGSTTSRQSNEIIINQLGIGIVSFRETPEEPETPDVEIPVPQYTYRTGTKVFTSLSGIPTGDVVEGNTRDGYTIRPTEVTFSLSDTTNGARIINSKTTAYKSDDTVWLEWETPDKAKNMTVVANVKYAYQHVNQNNGNVTYRYETERIEIPVEVVELEENTPPNPVADDRNDNWRMSSIPKIANDVTERTWNEYEYEIDTKEIYNDKGEWLRNQYAVRWIKHEYKVKLEADIDVYPDPLCKTYTNDGYGNYTMKSGYGVRQTVNATLKRTVRTTSDTFFDGTTRNEEDTHTTAIPIQNGVSYFSDFNFKDYFRLLDLDDISNRKSTLSFRNNRFSTYNNPTHFTPIWYPDNTDYIVSTYVFDAWTPAGQLGMQLQDSVYIYGNLWDDYHVAPTK